MLKGELLWEEVVGFVPKPPNILKIQNKAMVEQLRSG